MTTPKWLQNHISAIAKEVGRVRRELRQARRPKDVMRLVNSSRLRPNVPMRSIGSF
jgi:hypothetical protein